MISIKYNKKLGNYVVFHKGKKFIHATLARAKEQVGAILNVERKRALRANK